MEDKFTEEQVGVRAGYRKDDHICFNVPACDIKMFCGK